MNSRYQVKCKDKQFLTYAVYDTQTNCWVSETENTNLEAVNELADEFNKIDQSKL